MQCAKPTRPRIIGLKDSANITFPHFHFYVGRICTLNFSQPNTFMITIRRRTCRRKEKNTYYVPSQLFTNFDPPYPPHQPPFVFVLCYSFTMCALGISASRTDTLRYDILKRSPKNFQNKRPSFWIYADQFEKYKSLRESKKEKRQKKKFDAKKSVFCWKSHGTWNKTFFCWYFFSGGCFVGSFVGHAGALCLRAIKI